jgi:hypothetical protein
MKSRLWLFVFTAIFQILVVPTVKSAELPVVRLAHAAFNEKVVALWLGVEQGFFRKHGVEVQLVYIRTGPQTIAALSGGEIQIIYTIPSVVLSAAAGGMDLAMFGGIVNKGIGAVSKIPVIGNALSGAVNALTGGADVGKAVADTASNISSDLGSGNIGGVINTIKSGVDTVKGVYDAGKRLFERN